MAMLDYTNNEEDTISINGVEEMKKNLKNVQLKKGKH
jgi:hypothetical protein